VHAILETGSVVAGSISITVTLFIAQKK
jgi:hypothetical protein